MIGFDKIKSHLKMFTSMLLGRKSFLVSHGKLVSVYDLIKNAWVQHFIFDSEVCCILKDAEEYGEQSIFIVLSSGNIELARQQLTADDCTWQLDENGQKIEGQIVKVVSDYMSQ